MFATEQGAMSGYGARTSSREMHASFFGAEAAVNSSHIRGADDAAQISQKLANSEWRKAGLEGVFPPELVTIIGQLTASLGSKFDKVVDFLAEAVNAEELRQKFGEPQVPGALSVSIRLTELAELAYDETQVVAAQVEKEIAWIRAEINKTILVWLLAEEARHQVAMDKLSQTEVSITGLHVKTSQATQEEQTAKSIIEKRKLELAIMIKIAKEKATNFFSQTFGSNTLNSAEVIIYGAQQKTQQLVELNFEKAIPVNQATAT